MLGNFWKLHAGKFLKLYAEKFFGTICWEIFWKLYAGKFFGSHMLENSGGCWWLFDGGNYGTMLQHHATDLRQWHQVHKLSQPAAQTEAKRSKQSYRKSRAGGWVWLNPI